MKKFFILIAVLILALITMVIIVIFASSRVEAPEVVDTAEVADEVATSTQSATTTTPTPTPTETRKTINGGLNERVVFNSLWVTPWAVTEDSRCPSDVQCIQAGKVTVALNIFSSIDGTFIRTAELEEGATIVVNDIRVTLSKVAPTTISTHKILDQEYRFTFEFEAQ